MRAHRRRQTAIGLIATVTLLGCGLAPAAARVLSRAHSAPGCNPVLFIGARGSSEYGPGSAHWPKGGNATDGFGGEVKEVYEKVSAGLSRNPVAYSVDYGADGVQTLFHDYPKYFRDLSVGVTWVMDKLRSRASACPDQQIVLAGYSQGAMVMHRVVRMLGTARAGAAILARIAAVVLVGDGDQVPHDNVTRFGTAGAGAHGIGLALRTVSRSSNAKLPPGIGSRVLEVCNKHDIVCGWTDLDLACLDIGIPTLPCANGVYIHLHYPGRKPLADAAAQAAADLRARLGLTTWGPAIEVPGTAALNNGGNAQVFSVSCASAGNCAVGGTIFGRGGPAFVASEVNGTWHKAIAVPGTTALSGGAGAVVESVSCPSAGNCGAGGYYASGHGQLQAFVASEVNGTWHTAIEVPGTAALDVGGLAQVFSVSCATVGSCVAGGVYEDGSGHGQAFVASEVNGTWRTAIEVPGTAGGGATVISVSCRTAGTCDAGGEYIDGSGTYKVFVASEVDGTWRTAIEVPGTAALNAADVWVSSLSCGSAGNCALGGYFTSSSSHGQTFVASEVNGTWGKATEVPGTAIFGPATVSSVSCAPQGSCVAGGSYTSSTGHGQAFVAADVNGIWGRAIDVPGAAGVNASVGTQVGPVSCGSAGNCAAGGEYIDGSGSYEVFVAREVNGAWRKAIEIPGTGALSTGEIYVNSMSCPPTGGCAAGGYYTDGTGHQQAFVASQP
jgi:hypothetical protein